MILGFLDFQNITFANPSFFWLLLLIPLLIFWHIKKYKKQEASFNVSSLEGIKHLPVSLKVRLKPLLLVLRLLGIVFITIAMARPRTVSVTENINSEGIDIVLCLDISGSMLAKDFDPNRLVAAKKVAEEFVKERPGDRIGLVVFAGESFTQCPITTDHSVLIRQINKIKSGSLEDGTAIGMGLATSVDRLKESKAKSKVVILLTDGVNNTGLIDPQTALEIAKSYNIKVYTIGVGTRGYAPFPVPTRFGGTKIQRVKVQIDEKLMKKIANETGGEYFRATDNKSLFEIYDQIDKLEKTKMKVTSYKKYKEWFYPFALIALGLLLIEILLRYTVFKSLP